MNLAFAGTPDFAAWVLTGLLGLGRQPRLVITQPDRPQGRGRRSAPPAAATEAARLGLEYVQTDDINSQAILELLGAKRISALVVAAFGQILRERLLDAVLCLNVHASLLPAYRGAAPVERALAAGEPCTGVSIMRITERLDEGPWALQKPVPIGMRDDAGTLARVLALLGAAGVDQVLTGLDDGNLTWTEQEGASSYAAKLTPAHCALDVTRGAKAAHNQVRSLSPGIGAQAAAGGLLLKIWRAWPYGQPGLDTPPAGARPAEGRPGHIAISGERLYVGCSEGVLEILMLQPAGKSKMSARAFLRGYGTRLGARLEPGAPRQACEQADRGDS